MTPRGFDPVRQRDQRAVETQDGIVAAVEALVKVYEDADRRGPCYYRAKAVLRAERANATILRRRIERESSGA